MGPVQSQIEANKKMEKQRAAEMIKKYQVLENEPETGLVKTGPNETDMAAAQKALSQLQDPAYTATMGREKSIELLALAAPLLGEDVNSEIWNMNHNAITQSILKMMGQRGAMPSATEIGKDTGLSRQAVARHLKEYRQKEEFQDKKQQYKLVEDRISAMIVSKAVSGDLKAAKLYFEMVNKEDSPSPVQNAIPSVKTQNNYVQINGIVIDQNALEQLAPEQLSQIESVFRSSLAG